MTADPYYLATALGAAAAVTLALRAAPFLIKSALTGSRLLADLGTWMPLGAIVILAAYCLTRLDLTSPVTALPQFAGLIMVVAIHLWRGNLVLTLLSGGLTSVALANFL